MRILSSLPTRPTSAEQVRSVLAAAASMTVVTDGGRSEAVRADTGPLTDRVRLHPLLPTPGGPDTLPGRADGAASVEFTDVAPVPVRDRVRARVTLMGRLQRPDPVSGGRELIVEQALLQSAERRAVVGVDELLTARTDPLATCEAGMLMHLVGHHADLVTVLMRLVDPRFCQGVVRALPLALDRYGVTLRLEYLRRYRDVRLAFASPVERIEGTRDSMHALLAEAQRTSPRHRRAAGLRDTRET